MKLVLLEQMALLSLIVYCLIDTAMCDCFLCIVVFFFLSHDGHLLHLSSSRRESDAN